ncbi:hypothetical protein WOLCODRAFT_147905 [Wolfiporia cocos MD-104 SS10]|uniref:Ribosome biogenesis protein SLX9 n=1 Tax=Wolfiporia cocos (strain MD-104) TaxID=742152 RepID=A0A2H3IV25_WOLCO|nr:hypothetical protein WOLCODRAFT_147905 [Wolfiporia cocos MD-104 SS10]
MADASGAEILQQMNEPDESRAIMKKKEKQALKHELFMKRLESTRSPYSRSQKRKLEREAKEKIGGGMDDMKAAILAMEDDTPQAEPDGTTTQPKPRTKPGQIGEGKAAPLNKKQRKRALQIERMRMPMILSTPEFSSNPFQTIRTHAQNTLVKHVPPQ